MAEAVFASVAVVAELLTFPAVAIVANLVSAIAADALMSAFTIVPSAIFADVTASLLILAVVTALAAMAGEAAVPVRSPANCIFPFVVASASGAPEVMLASTYSLMYFTAGYFVVDAASAATSVLKLAVDCAPNAVNAAAAVVAPVPPFVMGNVPVMAATGKLLALLKSIADGTPKSGVINTGLVNVLLVKVSVPANVAKVPVAPGNVIVVVPATAGAAKVAVPDVEPAKPTLVADDTPKVGVTKVGEFANTKAPEPVSFVTAVAKFALVGVPKNPPTPVPKSDTSAITIDPQAGAADAEPVPVCVKNCLVADVLPVKSEVVLAAD